ncbi:hypothetical protein AB0H76_29560 [Nocardia sp. NPDC050712]|uniref:hypothetical protein n=1 Tax=Nocardia sp. NPDC050712 TaxID=3155518 RepID=UPI0033C458ED
MRISARTFSVQFVFWLGLAIGLKWLLDRFAADSWPRPWVDLGLFAVVFVVLGVLSGLWAHRAARRKVDRIYRLLAAGSHPAAIPPIRDMLLQCSELEGPLSDNALHWHHKLAEVLGWTDRTAEALPHASIAVQGREAVFGPYDSRTVASRRLYETLVQREAVDPLVDLLGDWLRRDETGSHPDA